MIKFIQDYTTKALPPEIFEAEQEVERSPESELYLVRLGVAGFLIDGVLVDQDYRPIVVQAKVIEVVSSADRRFADGGRGGELLGIDAPQRASPGPGNAAMFGNADPNLRQVQVDQLASDLAASVQQLDDHRSDTTRQIEELTNDLTSAQGAREAALADFATAQGERDKASSELAEANTRYVALETEHAAAVEKIGQLEQQVEAAANREPPQSGTTGKPPRGK